MNENGAHPPEGEEGGVAAAGTDSTNKEEKKSDSDTNDVIMKSPPKDESLPSAGASMPLISHSTLPSAANSGGNASNPSSAPNSSAPSPAPATTPQPPASTPSPTPLQQQQSSTPAPQTITTSQTQSAPATVIASNINNPAMPPLIQNSSQPPTTAAAAVTTAPSPRTTPTPPSSGMPQINTPTPSTIAASVGVTTPNVSRSITPTTVQSSLMTTPQPSAPAPPPSSATTSVPSSSSTSMPSVITSTVPPLPPGVLNTPTGVDLAPLPRVLSSKMPLPPEALASSVANNIPLPPGVLTSGPPPGIMKTTSGMLPEGIRPMTAVTSSTQQQQQQQQNHVSSHRPPAPQQLPFSEPQLPQDAEPPNMQAILAYLRKYNLGDTESMLKEEIKKRETTSSAPSAVVGGVKSLVPAPGPGVQGGGGAAESEVGNVLAKYKSDGDPSSYEAAYSDLQRFIENSLDQHKHELALILYPVFVHMYLELVYNQHELEAVNFINKYAPSQENYYQEDIKKLSYVKKREHMAGNELIDNFKTSLFTVRMSRDTYQQLRDHKKKNNEKHHTLLWNLIHDHLFLDMYEGHGRSKSQIDSTAGAMVGEAQRQANRAKVYYGLPREPDIQYPTIQEEEEETEVDGDKPKKKKKKDVFIQRKSKTDPNAPIATRMPFPDLRDSDKLEKAKALRESLKRANLGPSNIPSICMYTLMNVSGEVTALAVTDDSSMLAAGLSDSRIKVWSLLNHKLKKLKPASALADINREAEDVLHRMMDDTTAETCKELVGHSGPVYAVSFSPDRTFLLSGSEDGAIRLWSMQTWTCLVLYKGHVYPVWDVQFSPLGYYFASCGHDRTARLWTTEQANPLRIFQGHFSDIDCLAFHPNSNYVGTGSSDRSVRLWDCVTGSCVRFMTGHKAAVNQLAFSPDGRFIASGSSDMKVLIWDIAFGHLVAELGYHTNVISGLAFSREGTILASCALDCSLALWDFGKVMSESGSDEVNVTQNPEIMKDVDTLLLGSYRTKSTPILHLHFTRRNLLLAIGSFEPAT